MRLIAILLAMLCHPALSAAAADVPADVARYLAGLPVAAAGPLRDLTAGGVLAGSFSQIGRSLVRVRPEATIEVADIRDEPARGSSAHRPVFLQRS